MVAFFFRGVLQSLVTRWRDSARVGVVVSALAFGLYHLPYAYRSPLWSTHGDLVAALGECGMAAIAGAAFGWVFVRSGRNLVAAVTCHALVDTLPALTQMDFALRLG